MANGVDDVAPGSQDKPAIDRQCEWIMEQLESEKAVTSAEFKSEFGENDKIRSDWSRVHRAVHAVLSKLDIPVKLVDAGSQNAKLVLNGKLEPTRYTTRGFRPDEEFKKKQRIGELVARYLKDQAKIGTSRPSVLLGSGSTIYHVGLKMIDCGHYESRLFWTVNVALAAAWCERGEKAPVDKVTIPEGVLEAKTFRFGAMKPPAWSAAVVVVGADGCHYDAEEETLTLYANEHAIADNTDLFVGNAKHMVIVCLASSKIGGRNMGPIIHPPKENIIRVLVTDAQPSEEIAAVFENDNWLIVTDETDWSKVEDRVAQVFPERRTVNDRKD